MTPRRNDKRSRWMSRRPKSQQKQTALVRARLGKQISWFVGLCQWLTPAFRRSDLAKITTDLALVVRSCPRPNQRMMGLSSKSPTAKADHQQDCHQPQSHRLAADLPVLSRLPSQVGGISIASAQQKQPSTLSPGRGQALNTSPLGSRSDGMGLDNKSPRRKESVGLRRQKVQIHSIDPQLMRARFAALGRSYDLEIAGCNDPSVLSQNTGHQAALNKTPPKNCDSVLLILPAAAFSNNYCHGPFFHTTDSHRALPQKYNSRTVSSYQHFFPALEPYLIRRRPDAPALLPCVIQNPFSRVMDLDLPREIFEQQISKLRSSCDLEVLKVRQMIMAYCRAAGIPASQHALARKTWFRDKLRMSHDSITKLNGPFGLSSEKIGYPADMVMESADLVGAAMRYFHVPAGGVWSDGKMLAPEELWRRRRCCDLEAMKAILPMCLAMTMYWNGMMKSLKEATMDPGGSAQRGEGAIGGGGGGGAAASVTAARDGQMDLSAQTP